MVQNDRSEPYERFWTTEKHLYILVKRKVQYSDGANIEYSIAAKDEKGRLWPLLIEDLSAQNRIVERMLEAGNVLIDIEDLSLENPFTDDMD
jgi:hypothetical protein